LEFLLTIIHSIDFNVYFLLNYSLSASFIFPRDPQKGGTMSKVIFGLLFILFIILFFLLFWIVVLGAALLIFGRKSKKREHLSKEQGFT